MKFLFAISFLIITSDAYSQVIDSITEIIDPIEIPCYQLYPDQPIKHYRGSIEYIGRILFNVKVDTINQAFTDYRIVYAKLFHRYNPNDSIEIRMDYKVGNYKYIESIKDSLISHLGYLQIKKTGYEKCINTTYTIPLTID